MATSSSVRQRRIEADMCNLCVVLLRACRFARTPLLDFCFAAMVDCRLRGSFAKSASSSPSSHTIRPSRFKMSTFSSRNAMPPPCDDDCRLFSLEMVGVLCFPFTEFVFAILAKISGIDIPMLEAMISSVSSQGELCPSRQTIPNGRFASAHHANENDRSADFIHALISH